MNWAPKKIKQRRTKKVEAEFVVQVQDRSPDRTQSAVGMPNNGDDGGGGGGDVDGRYRLIVS